MRRVSITESHHVLHMFRVLALAWCQRMLGGMLHWHAFESYCCYDIGMDATVCSSRRGPSVTPSRSHQLTFRMGHEQLVMYTLLAFIAGSAIAQLSYAQMGQPGRDLQTMPTHCHPLSKDLLSKIAVDNHVLISVMDEMVWHIYGESWVRNVQQAGITYFVSAGSSFMCNQARLQE